MSAKSTVIRGPVLTYTGDPCKSGLDHTMVYESDGIVAIANGLITHFGPADKIRPQLPPGTEIKGKDSLISAGFIDSHVHFPQTSMIAAYGEQLLNWLNKYTFPTELKYSDKEFARSVAKVFLQENFAQWHHVRMHLLHGLSPIGRRSVRGSREAWNAPGGWQGADGPQRA